MCWFCSTETYVGLVFNDIFPKDYIVKKTKKQLYMKNSENFDGFMENWFMFKKNYRMSNQKRWAKKYDMNTASNMNIVVPNLDKIYAHIKRSVDRNITQIDSVNALSRSNPIDIGKNFIKNDIDQLITNGLSQTQGSITYEAESFDHSSMKIKIKETNGGSTDHIELPLYRIDYKRVKSQNGKITIDTTKVVLRFVDEPCQSLIFPGYNDSSNTSSGSAEVVKCPHPIGFRGAAANQGRVNCGVSDISNANESIRETLNRFLLATTFSYTEKKAFIIEIDASFSSGLSVYYSAQNGTIMEKKFCNIDPKYTADFTTVQTEEVSPVIQVIKKSKSLVTTPSGHTKTPCEDWERDEDEKCPEDCIRQDECHNNKKDDAGRCPCKTNKKFIKYFKKLGIDIEDLTDQVLNGSPPEEGEKDKNKDAEKPPIESAFIFMSLPMLDPYLIEAGTYKASVAEKLPTKVLKKAKLESNGTDYTITEEVSSWWKKKNRMKREKYARLMIAVASIYSGGTIKIDEGDMESTISLNIQKEVKSGIMPLYDFDHSPHIGQAYIRSKATDKTMIIHHQLTATEYEVISISDQLQTIEISGIDFELNGGGIWGMNEEPMGEQTCDKPIRLFVPIDLIDSIGFTEYVMIKEHGTTLLLYAKKVVETSWFLIILAVVAAIAICAMSAGAGCSVGTMLIGMVVSAAATVIGKMVGGKLGVLIQIFGAIVTLGMGGLSMMNLLNFAATSGMAIVDYYQQIEIKREREIAKRQHEIEASEGIQDKLDGVNDDHMLMLYGDNISVYYNFIEAHSPPAMRAAVFAPISKPAVAAIEKTSEVELKSRVVPG